MRTYQCAVVVSVFSLLAPRIFAAEVPQTTPASEVAFSIEAQPLKNALNAWASRTGYQILLPSDGGAVLLMAPKVAGSLSPEAALRQLLTQSGLTYEFVDARTVAIRVAAGSKTSSNSSILASEANVRLAQATGTQSDSIYVAMKSEKAAPELALGKLDEIVITGTHIRGVAPDSSPVTIYDRKAIEQTGVATVEQFVRKIPQNFALIDSDTAFNSGNNPQAQNNTFLGTGINLHGAGSGSTLILLNGHRMAPAGFDGSFVDVSMIPLSAVDRVEVLTDGASAIYGADAVAGVVNFVLRKDFQGAETSLHYGETSGGGAQEFGASQLLGTSWNSGNVVFSYDHYDQNPLYASQRSFIPDQGGKFMVYPDSKRNSAFLTARQQVNSRATVFGDAFYSKRDSVQDIFQFIRSHDETDNTQSGAVLGLDVDIAGDWRGELLGNFSRTAQSGTFTNDFGSTSLDNRSDLLAYELRADGTVFSLPGGNAKASLGAGFRKEKFEDLIAAIGSVGSLDRDVTSAFAELFVPLIGKDNSKPGMQRLELSLAARFDDYNDFGSSTDPKVGILWAPITGLNFRGTYATSYRAPPLPNLSATGQIIQIYPIPDPAAPSGVTATLFQTSPSNPTLQPEESTTYTVGIDYRPPRLQGLSIALSYYKIDYDHRLAQPPLIGSLLDVYSQTDTLAPFIHRDPSPAEIANATDNMSLLSDPFGIGLDGVEAIFDFRLQNIAISKIAGIEGNVDYYWATEHGDFAFFAAANYLTQSDFRSLSTTPSVDVVNTIFNPMDFKLRSGITWSQRTLSASLSANYLDHYNNNLTVPATTVSSWTTFDLQLGYHTAEHADSAWQGVSINLNAQNLFDKDPPRVVMTNPVYSNFGYDSTNASPRGRLVSILVSKRW